MISATFPKLAHDWLKHEQDTDLHRRAGTIASGAGVLETGAVLGRVTATGKYVPWDPEGADGSENFAGFLLNGVDATDADQRAAIVTGYCVVVPAQLSWADGIAAGDKSDLLAAIDATHHVRSAQVA